MAALDVTTLQKIATREALGGSVLAVDDETGAGRVRYVPGPELTNVAGVIYGGHIAGMVDDAGSLATWFAGRKRMFATAQLSVSFVRAARPLEPLVADAECTGVGARTAFVNVVLRRERDGAIVATGSLIQNFSLTDSAASS